MINILQIGGPFLYASNRYIIYYIHSNSKYIKKGLRFFDKSFGLEISKGIATFAALQENPELSLLVYANKPQRHILNYKHKIMDLEKNQDVYMPNNGAAESYCFYMLANWIISNNDSKEKADSCRERFEQMKPICINKDERIELWDYQEGVKQVYSQDKLMTYKMYSKEPVDMDCVKEALIQMKEMNDKKKIFKNKLGVAERIISDGLIGVGQENLNAKKFMRFLKEFMEVSESTYYEGRPEKEKIAKLLTSEPKSKEEEKVIDFAKQFIKKYEELKETKL